MISKFYKIIDPNSIKVSVTDNQDTTGNYGLYGNYSWYHKLIQGSSVRLMRYREFDLMSMDIQVARALDIISEEVCGIPDKMKLPMDLQIIAGNEQFINSQTVVTLKAMLGTWCNIHQWRKRLYFAVRAMLKYGDCFFLRNKIKNKKFIFLNPKNVVGAIVSQEDINDVAGWQIRADFNKVSESPNLNFAIMSNDSSQTYSTENFEAEDVIRFTLNDEMSDEAPFGNSILATIYRDFKRKELLEDSLIIYRIQRAPEKRVFYIDVGKMPPHQIAQHLEQVKNELKQKKIPSPYGGRNQVESIYNPNAMCQDFYMRRKSDGSGSSVEMLPSGNASAGGLDDLDYFYDKLWIGLKVPKSYIDNTGEGGAYSDGAVGVAYMAELQFNEYIERLQVHIEEVLDREFKKFLLDNKIKIDPTIFKIVLSPPSNFAKYREQAINNALISSYQTVNGMNHISKRFAMEKYLGMTKEEIIVNERMKAEELGMNPNYTKKDYPKLYAPEDGEVSGFSGGMGGVGAFGNSGQDIGPNPEGSDMNPQDKGIGDLDRDKAEGVDRGENVEQKDASGAPPPPAQT